jgi:signal transduction histidine kinase
MRKWISVLLPLAAGFLGSTAYWGFASASASWGQVLPSLYCIPIVIAAIRLGAVPAVIVALAAGGFHGIGSVLARGEGWAQPLVQTLLMVGLGLTAAKLAEWQGARATFEATTSGSGSMETGFGEARDAAQLSAMDRVVVGLARQFRTPVTSIEGAGWVLEDAALPAEKRQEFVGIVRKESHRLNRFLADVLDFTQPRKPRFHSVELSPLVDEVIQLASPKDQGASYRFLKDVPANFPPLRCDPEQIRQVLLSLAMNAVQASPGGGQIEISARLAQGNAVIRVKDHGRGIPAALLDRVFDPFFTSRENCLGLGLPMALHIVTEHGGRIIIESSSDQGTCFAVILPAAPAAER